MFAEDCPMFGLPRLIVPIPPWRPPYVCYDAPFYPLFTERRWLPNIWKPIDPLPEYDMYNFDELEHKYGIPVADFIDDVDKFMRKADDQGGKEVVLKKMKELHANYKFMERNLIRRREIIRKQITDGKISMKALDFLDDKVKEEKNAYIMFKATDYVYMKAKILPDNKVITHMGGNLYLPYRVHQTWSFIWQNDKKLFQQIYKNEEDLQFIYNQITITEVNMSKVYNWNVKQKYPLAADLDILYLMDDILDSVVINVKVIAVREISHLLEQMIFSCTDKTTTEEVDEKVLAVLNEIIDLVEVTTTKEMIVTEKMPSVVEQSLGAKIFTALKEKFASFKKMFKLPQKKKYAIISLKQKSEARAASEREFLLAENKIGGITCPDWNLTKVEEKTSEIEEIEYELENIVDDVKFTSLAIEAKKSTILSYTSSTFSILTSSTSSIPSSITIKTSSTSIESPDTKIDSPTSEMSVLDNEWVNSANKLSSALKELSISSMMLSIYKEKLEARKSMLSLEESSDLRRRKSITMSEVDLLTLPGPCNESKKCSQVNDK